MRTRANIGAALALIAIGAWFLAIELSPAVKAFAYGADTWPLPIIGIGALLAVLGLLTWTPGLLVPACIVGGIGGMLYYQNTTGEWETWAYSWALIPAFIGLGMLLAGAMERNRGLAASGAWMILWSLVMFAVFGSFLGGSALIGQYWPLLLIFAGLIVLLQGLFRRRQ
ncbi:MAG: hypothetical protein JXB15_11610 [Anaerolineales bacterium]|nr:hypothetical protein [Anaerolineales bacterium]